MPKLEEGQLPKYRLHKSSGQAIVTLSGRDFLLGKYDSEESKTKYRRLTAEWQARRAAPSAALPQPDLTVAELLALFERHARVHYCKNGRQTSEYVVYRSVIRPLLSLYGDTAVAEFGPLKLQVVVNEMVSLGWVRRSINNHIHRIRNIFRWGVAQELVAPSIIQALRAVPALQKGRTKAKENPPVRPVTDAQIEAMLPHVSRQVAALILVLRYTGMRPSEGCNMRGCDLDIRITEDKPDWEYRPSSHKNEHHEMDRVVVIGRRARAVLEPFLRANPQEFLFSPAEAEVERRAKRHKARKTPLGWGNAPYTNRTRNPKCRPRDRYTVASLRRAIERGCELAFGMPRELHDPRTQAQRAADTPEKRVQRRRARAAWHRQHVWHPNQLRHAFATEVAERLNTEAAQAVLGHAHLSTTEIYAERTLRLRREVIAKVG